MKLLAISYLILYILVALGAGVYSFFKTKKMRFPYLLLLSFFLLIVVIGLIYYAQGYHPVQMVVFALSFTAISSLFFYTSYQGEDSKFLVVFIFSAIRFLIHIQLLALLYFLR